jgi:tetratricopeptide (TPR) repeat protein
MARCWTCGTPANGYHYTCSSCENLTAKLKQLQQSVDVHGRDISQGLDYIARIQQEGFEALEDTLSEGLSGIAVGLSEIASSVAWGFGELSWQLQQQTSELQSIDHTLKTPSQTQANEWRQIAEDLRHRGVLDKSEEFYLKALEVNPLDYRIYVGLAETYLQGNKFDKAKVFLEKSLPHAPKQEIDYKSYSYRLVGHIYACEENYRQAASTLHTAVQLSKDYTDGHYDLVQYCARLENRQDWAKKRLSSLEWVILRRPVYYSLVQHERNFDPVRSEVKGLLARINAEAARRARDAIAKAETALMEADEAVDKELAKTESAISAAKQALATSREKATLSSARIHEDAKSRYHGYYRGQGASGTVRSNLLVAKEKGSSGDYAAILEAQSIAEKCGTAIWEAAGSALRGAQEAKGEADRELGYYERRYAQKQEKAQKVIGEGLLGALAAGVGGWMITGFVGCCIRAQDLDIHRIHGNAAGWVIAHGSYTEEGIWGGIIFFVIALVAVIYGARKELE